MNSKYLGTTGSRFTRQYFFLQIKIHVPVRYLDLEGEVQLYAIQPAHDGNPLRLEEKPLPRDGLSADFYAVQAIAEPSGKQGFNVTIFCDHREFSELEHGTRLYAEVAKHILSQRQSREAYPCYITDLDLSAIDPGERMQTAQYLRYRQQLERALNQAMGALR